MGVVTFSHEYACSVPAPRLFKAMIDSANLLPKLLPDNIKSIEYVQGDGGVGSLVKTTSTKGHVINKVEAIDTTNLCTKYVSVEGGLAGDKIESVVFETKYEASGEGCVSKTTIHFHTKGDANVDEEVKTAKEQILAFVKVVADYLVANPGAYC